MKKNKEFKLLPAIFIGASLACGAATVSAATVSEITTTLHWGTLNLTQGAIDYTSVVVPGEGTISVEKDAAVIHNGVEVSDAASGDSPLYVSGSSGGVTVDAGVDYASSSDIYFHALATNDALGTVEDANGWAFKGLIFTPTADGQVTFTVDYSIDLSVGTDPVSYPDGSYAGAGYELYFGMGSVDTWLSIYDGTIESEDAAEVAAFIDADSIFDNDTYSSWSDCVPGALGCGLNSLSTTGTLTVSAILNAGENYFLDGDVGGWVYTDTVSAVPVPAAVWLFGSGLIGLIGMARRKKI